MRRSLIVLTGALAVSGPLHAQTPAPIARPPLAGAPVGVTAFLNVNVVPMDTERVLPNQTVLIGGGRIIALGPSGQVKVPAGATRIDARGKHLIPGLGDMHAHVFPWERRYGDTDSARAVNKLFYVWLANGVTTIRNVDYSAPSFGKLALQLRARQAAGELLSPRIYTAGPWTGVEGIEASTRAAPSQVASLVAAYKAAGYDFIKIHEERGSELWDSLGAAARREGLPLIGHLPKDLPGPGRSKGTYRLDWALAVPMRSVDHVTILLQTVHKLYKKSPSEPLLNAAEIETLRADIARAGMWHCPTLTIHTKNGAFSSPSETAAVSQLLKVLQDANPGLLLGTDYIEEIPTTVQDELQTLVQAGLTPYQALLTGTRNVAVYFGTLDETGTVAVGKRADLVLLEGNPLADIHHATGLAGVILGGRWLDRSTLDRLMAAANRPLPPRSAPRDSVNPKP